MRMAGAKQVHYDSGPNMTPLVDVVMVILIFLMLAGSFGSSEHFIASKTPISTGGAGDMKPDPSYKPPVNLDVKISDNGDFTLSGDTEGGRMVVMSDPEMLKRKLEARLAQLPDKKNVQVILRPTPTTRWDNLVPLYDAALRANYEKVTFAMTGT